MPDERIEGQVNDISEHVQTSNVHASSDKDLENRHLDVSQQEIDQLPADVKALPEEAKNTFLAAFKSAQDDGMDEQSASQLAWTTVKHDYIQAEGGWQRKPDETNIHNKSVQSGGN